MSVLYRAQVDIVSRQAPFGDSLLDLGNIRLPYVTYTVLPPTSVTRITDNFTYFEQFFNDEVYTLGAEGITIDSLNPGFEYVLNRYLPLALSPVYDIPASYNTPAYWKRYKFDDTHYLFLDVASVTSVERYSTDGSTLNSGGVIVPGSGSSPSNYLTDCVIIDSQSLDDVIVAYYLRVWQYRDGSVETRVINTSNLLNTKNFFSGVTPYLEPSDPYSQGGESDVGGGTGNFDGTSVDVDFTSLPTLSAVDTGFITLYNPTVAQLQSLASYMWSDLFDLDTLKKLFADPMQAILGLSIVPGPVPSAGAQAVKVGNISTGITMTKAASQYIDVDCGTLNVEEFWGAYLDYEPYTKAEIYLPYIGTHQIAVDDVMGKAVHIKYHIDILSGACAAEIKCGGSVLYTFIGSVAVSIPVTGNDWTNVINGVLSIAGAVGSLVATGGAAAPAAAGEIASAAVNSLKPNIEKSGAVSGGGGLMAGKVPVLILTRPRQALPASQNEFTGYPAFITRSLGAVSGYTEVHKIRLGGISATDAELDEIENLLKGGVIL